MLRKTALTLLIVAVVGLLLIQLVPYGRDHTNPPAVQEPAWDSPATRELAQRACFACHSNETVWPWYSNVAPVSWLVAHDTFEGRDRLNFSEWTGGGEIAEIAGIVREGEMPPGIYVIQHPSARLTDAERNQLVQGLQNSLR